MLVDVAAVVLRTVDTGESHRVVTLLTRERGRLGAVARGARRSQRRFGASLSMGAVGTASLRERAGADLATLERFEATDLHPSLALDVARLAHAAYALELATKLCAPGHAEPAAYDFLVDFLALLDQRGASAARLRVFELGLLVRLGLGPVVEHCAVCGRTSADLGEGQRTFEASRGGIVCRACGGRGRPVAGDVAAALVAIARAALADAETLALPAAVNAACRELLADALAIHLHGPLRSVEFIAKLGGH